MYLLLYPQVIQTFVPCIFGGKNSVHEILGIRLTSFLMENYAEVFKVGNVNILYIYASEYYIVHSWVSKTPNSNKCSVAENRYISWRFELYSRYIRICSIGTLSMQCPYIRQVFVLEMRPYWRDVCIRDVPVLGRYPYWKGVRSS